MIQAAAHKKLRIAILGTRGIPNRYGGFEQCAEHLSTGLVQLGHEVTVYNSHNHEYQGNNWNGVHVVHCYDAEHRIGTAGQFLYDLNCIMHARSKKFDVLLQLGYTSSSVWHMLWPKRPPTLVNMDGLEWMRTKYSKPVQRFLRYAEKLAVRHADLLVSDSLGIQKYIEAEYGKPSVYIPYGAETLKQPDAKIIDQFGVQPFNYHLVIARLVPENSVDIIIEGYLQADDEKPLLVVGKKEDPLSSVFKKQYAAEKNLVFIDDVYEAEIINNLRYFSAMYFHGHSVGGTNPSLLEAMACKALIAAHDNVFNRTILGEEGVYFNKPEGVAAIIEQYTGKQELVGWLDSNYNKITSFYNWENITRMYEQAFFTALENNVE